MMLRHSRLNRETARRTVPLQQYGMWNVDIIFRNAKAALQTYCTYPTSKAIYSVSKKT